ncbi:MAG: cytochrome c oxidase subunit 3 [Bacteroidetes bacterium]|nr:cytochrome c oxidase subunit 3 [Bacteroidota bacterium]
MSQTDHAHAAESHGHIHRDDIGSKMGMWLFLFTELLLFGGMFLIYAVYRYQYPDQFHIAGMELDTGIGTLNTIILLTSSLTVALSIAALQRKNKFLSVVLLLITIVLAFSFMINKYFEWGVKFEHGLYPGSETLLGKPNGEILFFGLYFIMTGLHGLHVVIGIIFLSIILAMIIKDKITFDNYVKLENSGLYWHLVDLIWIFLFPLFYLIQ